VADKVLVELTRAEVELLAARAEMEPTEHQEAERLGLVIFSGPVRSKLADKLRATLASDQPQVEEEYRELVEGVKAEIQRLEEVDRYAPLKAASRATAERLQRLLDQHAAEVM
jgi:hypothetical protein